jgi:hypothetical protein
MIVFERRACVILYNLLRSSSDPRPWLLPVNVCADVAVTFIEARRTFELVDIAEDSLEIDIRTVVTRMQERAEGYAGVMLVRAYGNERDCSRSFARLRFVQPDIFLIDDKCLCRPDVDGLARSELADVTLFSTGRTKYAGLGSGGFAHLGPSVTYSHHQRARFDALALAEVQRRCRVAISTETPYPGNVAGWLDSAEPETVWEEHRRRTIAACTAVDEQKRSLNAIYGRTLPPEIQLPAEFQSWRFNILVSDSEALVASIVQAGLFASRHYAPLHHAFGTGMFPVAERVHGRIVNLFNDFHYDAERARRTADLVLRHIES